MKAKLYLKKELATNLIWDFCSASKIQSFLSNFGIEERSDLEPGLSKRAYLNDVFSKVEDDALIEFFQHLVEYIEERDFEFEYPLKDGKEFFENFHRLKQLLIEINAGYSFKSNVNYVFFASIKKPEIVLNTASGILEDVNKAGFTYQGPYRNNGVTNKDIRSFYENSNLKNYYTDYNELLDRFEASNQTEPERFFFLTYLELFPKDSDVFLFPQVWLNWDPMTKNQRFGKKIIHSQRIDFLWLGPNNKCLILEIDGSSHWTDNGKDFSQKKYSEQVKSDRDYFLKGFNVIRFTNSEILEAKKNNNLKEKLKVFFAHIS